MNREYNMKAAPSAASPDKRGRKSKKPRKPKRYYDWYLLVYIILILCFGLIMLFSASVYYDQINYGKLGFFFFKQIQFSLIGIFIMIVISRIPFHPLVLSITAWLMYFVSLVMMILVPYFGVESHNAKRWLVIMGFSVQPSEIAKISVVLLVPWIIAYFDKRKKDPEKSSGNMVCLVSVLLIGAIAGGLAWKATDNLSTGIIIVCIAMGIYIISKPHPLPYVIISLIVLAGVYFYAYKSAGTLAQSVVSEAEIKSFRKRRLAAWRDPYKFISGSGWQVIQGLYAIGSGGWLGKGLGRSTQKFNNIPEAQNDFIFPIICEELGFFGALLVILLFMAILYRLLYIAGNTRNKYGYYVLIGIFFHISIQVIFNIAVVLNLIPTTGVSLPFISSGGTALILLLFEMGIALSISRGIVLKRE